MVVARTMMQQRNAATQGTGLPKYNSVGGVGMSYSLPIIVIFGGLMAVTFAINPFRWVDILLVTMNRYLFKVRLVEVCQRFGFA
jgi:hypothetical protein